MFRGLRLRASRPENVSKIWLGLCFIVIMVITNSICSPQGGRTLFSFIATWAASTLILVFVATPLSSAVPGIKTYVVTNTASSGSGSLNEAVFQANYNGGDLNYINFNIPSSGGVVEIILSDTLYIARPMVLNGVTQPGYAGNPLVRINANGFASAILLAGNVANVPPFSNGTTATSSGSTVQGFQITNYSSNAVTIFKESQGNWIQNNWMGFKQTAPGTFVRNVVAHPGCRGVGMASSFNTIRHNVISGVDNGITIGDDIGSPSGNSYVTNALENNFIGTDPTGATKIGNDSDGIFLGAGAAYNYIGPGNVLSGMASSGVELLHPTNHGNIVIGNLIGLNAAGNAAIPNGELGVLVANGAEYNDIGSGNPLYGNVISGNILGGVVIGQIGYAPVDYPYGNWVENNLIGTDKTGTRIIPGQGTGITVQNKSKTIAVKNNIIVGETNNGILVSDSISCGFYGNRIGQSATGVAMANQGYGIWLMNHASYNFIQVGSDPNVFGTNGLGPIGVDASGTCVGNVFGP